jgi:hypothetical protein
MEAATQAAHPFEIFGPGPYTFVGFSDSDSREAEQNYRMNAGLPYTTNLCGGSCDLCGTAIWNVYTFESASGFKFKVGVDCAAKAGEGQSAKEGRRSQQREKFARESSMRREERLEGERDRNEDAGHGRLTDDEVIAAIEAAVQAAREAQRAASRHWGAVGVRVKAVELRYEGHYTFETAYGMKTLYFLRTLDGNATIWGTTSCLDRRSDGTIVERGETFSAAMTIKKHGEYKGERQTEVARLKVL